jgi:transcriptional regulator with XRE-family HTH domain
VRGLTQEQLAAAAQIDSKHLQAIEAGDTNTTIATLTGLALGLRVPVAQLFQKE